MSEHDEEPREETRASRDEELPEGVDPETGVIEEQTPAEAADADGSEEQIKKAERAVATFNKRIDAIFGDNAPPLQCPRCEGLGRVWAVEESTPELVHPDNLEACENCNGHGRVLTGSKVPENATTVCGRCNGTGFRVVTPQSENVTPLVAAPAANPAAPPPAVMGWMNADGVFQPLGTPQTGNG
jgi:excinuclease UvrABC ATPase subunit